MVFMSPIADTVVTNSLLSNAPVVAPATTEIDSLGFEVTPELREQFRIWEEATCQEVLNYLHTNWGLTEVTLDRLVLKSQFVLPDRKNRNLYGQVAPGKIFTNSAGKAILHPQTNQPMIFTVWRRVDPPVPVPVPDSVETEPEINPTEQ
jgi:hypothetical protein